MKNILSCLIMFVMIFAVAGCASRTLERRAPVQKKRSVSKSASNSRESRESSDDPLFDLVFRKSRREQRSRHVHSDLLTPAEKEMMNKEHGKHWQPTDDKDWQRQQKNHNSGKKSSSDWVFGF